VGPLPRTTAGSIAARIMSLCRLTGGALRIQTCSLMGRCLYTPIVHTHGLNDMLHLSQALHTMLRLYSQTCLTDKKEKYHLAAQSACFMSNMHLGNANCNANAADAAAACTAAEHCAWLSCQQHSYQAHRDTYPYQPACMHTSLICGS